MKNVFFSILVPVYNVEKYIRRCIGSVLEQTYGSFELILVDDGSPDNSGAICDEYAETDPRVRVIHKENGGLISARRAGIGAARGEYYVFLDSDDYLAPDTLSILNHKILETGSDCVYYGWNNVDDNETVIGYSTDTDREFMIEDKRSLYKLVFSNNAFNSLCRKAVRHDLLNNADFSSYYHIQHAEDLLQSLDIFKAAQKVLFLPNRLYHYRTNTTSITHSIRYEKYTVDFTVRQKVLAFLKDENVWQKEDFAAYRAYCISLLVSEVRLIARFPVKFQKKKELLEQIRASEYYRNFLNADEYKGNKNGSLTNSFLFSLFRNKQYRMLIALEKARQAAGALRRK